MARVLCSLTLTTIDDKCWSVFVKLNLLLVNQKRKKKPVAISVSSIVTKVMFF